MKNKLILLISLILLITITSAVAEEMVLFNKQTKEFKGIEITLLRIGSSGSVRLKVGSVERTLARGTSEEVQGIRIKHILTENDFIKIDVNMEAECLEESDCEDNIPCTKNMCQLKECKYKQINGCEVRDECKPAGTLEDFDGDLKYCSDDYIWLERKAYKTPCIHNYECLTNYCEEYCSIPSELGGEQTYKKTKMAPAWVLIALGVLIILKYFIFLVNPEKAKKIHKNYLTHFSDMHFRYVSIIAILIAIAMIIWAVI